MDIADDITWKEHLADLIYTFIPVGEPKVRNRSQINFRCPFCGDSKKSLTKKRGFYYIFTASYHCFNCEANTTGLKLLKELAPDNIYADAIREYKQLQIRSLSSSFGSNRFNELSDEGSYTESGLIRCNPIPAWKHLMQDSDKWEHPTILSQEQSEYLIKRGVWSEYTAAFLCTKNKQTGIPFIVIPWDYMSQCIFYQLHNYTSDSRCPKYLFPNSIDLNDQEKPVFGIDAIDPSWKYVIVCEGVYDALSYKNGVCVGGRVVTDYQMKLLKERWPHHQIVTAFDNDEAGKRSVLRLCKGGSEVKFLNIFDLFSRFKVKDANEFIQLGDKAKAALQDKAFLEKCIKSPLEMQVDLLLAL